MKKDLPLSIDGIAAKILFCEERTKRPAFAGRQVVAYEPDPEAHKNFLAHSSKKNNSINSKTANASPLIHGLLIALENQFQF
jgi:hypothetical protein